MLAHNGSSHLDAGTTSLYRSLLLPSYAVSLTVSLVSLISLVFTLWIFLRRRDATAGARGMVLLIATDIFASMALAGVHVISLSEAANVTVANTPAWKRLSDIQFTATNVSLLLRNWWVAFLTLARLIVILFPLHVTEILTRRRQVVAFVIILIVSVAVSGARYAEEVACAVDADASTSGASASVTPSATVAASNSASCESFVIFFFVMQTGLPVPVVLVISVVLAVYLCTAPPTSTTEEAAATAAVAATAAGAARSSMAPPPPSRPQLLKRRATRILLVLAVTFTALEVPTLVCSMCLYTLPNFRSSELSRLLVSLSNCLVTLDTLANFFVFFVFSKSFKVEVKRCLCSRRLWQQQQQQHQQQQQQEALLLHRRGTSERRRPPATAMESVNEGSSVEKFRG